MDEIYFFDSSRVYGFYNKRLYFMTDDKEMFYAVEGTKTKVCDDVRGIFIYGAAIYYVTDGNDLYGSESGTKFTCLLRDIYA